jgi:hypothetical protein
MLLIGIGTACAAAGTAGAQTFVDVSSDITTSTTWSPPNIYRLTRQIYVRNRATLTIQAGTIIASTTNVGGSLAVSRESQIFVQGTEKDPVIMTSSADRATWVGGDPKTGSYRAGPGQVGCNEWGNLTVMGRAYISTCTPGAVATPNANNVAVMEGLVEAFPGDPNVRYGGGLDDDDSGSISYLSIRYGGKVIGLANELNGLSLGGIGRETDIHHLEVMNNVDDGVEIWGGTVNLKYFSVWNVGDDSLDVDQGWRGKAQFGLVVQGYSCVGSQGGGVGDNCLEMDGAENANHQPLTTGCIYNLTVIGQPDGGDSGTEWRDNCRMQIRNSIFMHIGDEVVRFQNTESTPACVTLTGYGTGGHLDWPTTWTTDHTVFPVPNAPANPADFYRSQLPYRGNPGKLIELKDSIFFQNNAISGLSYTEADNRNVFAAGHDNWREPAVSPITSITRSGPENINGVVIRQVTSLDPRPAGEAVTSQQWAPNDGFFCSAHFRGAFAPGCNWLNNWSAAYAFNLMPRERWTDVGRSTTGANGYPVLAGSGTLVGGSPTTLTLSNAAPNSGAVLLYGVGRIDLPFAGGIVVPNILLGGTVVLGTGSGTLPINFTWPNGVAPGTDFYVQIAVVDVGAPQFFAFTNALLALTP